MTAKVLMIQGTASSVGKSLIVTALCRLFHQEGLRVAPFKAQNMALNSAVTPDGREIGRSTATQAAAASRPATVDMNPILLKPEGDARSQLIVLGKVAGHLPASHYLERKRALWEIVVGALGRLREDTDLVIVEGAGSPAEINLRDGDIVNMRVAREVGAPVLLVGDIDRGGVFAAFVGTLELLEPAERALIRGFLINRFRGSLDLLRPGLTFLEAKTGKPVLGVLPHLRELWVADEDSATLESRQRSSSLTAALDVAVIRLPHLANFDDFDLLAAEPAVSLRYVEQVRELGSPDLIILPGSKTTIADLGFLRASGLAARTLALAAQAVPILGICGGYQMLGRRVADPDYREVSPGEPNDAPGLGLLPVETIFRDEKRTRPIVARGVGGAGWLARLAGARLAGYEIHQGETTSTGPAVFEIEDREGSHLDGCQSADGLIVGGYVHGLFENANVRAALIGWLGDRKGLDLRGQASLSRDAEYDRLADWLRASVDLARLKALSGL